MTKYIFAFVVALLAIGCGEPGPDPKVETSRVEAARELRTIFDRAGGRWEALSEADKATVLKQFQGNEANAKQMWSMMVSKGQGADTRTGAPPQ
jgi:hypothetical protein